jgi:hypothetical protein
MMYFTSFRFEVANHYAKQIAQVENHLQTKPPGDGAHHHGNGRVGLEGAGVEVV